MKNNVISIYGVPSSGKTTLSLKFVKEFANVPLTFGFQNVPGLSTVMVVKSQLIPKF